MTDAAPTTAGPTAGDGPVPPPTVRLVARRALEVAVLAAFAVTQPLLALLGENPTFFAAHGVSGAGLVGFALLALVVPAVPLVAADALAALAARRAGDVVHAGLCGILLALTVGPPVMRSVELGGAASVLLLAVGAAVGAVAVTRWSWILTVVRYAAFAPPLFVVSFLFLSPASALLGDDDVPGTAPGTAIEEPVPVVWLVLDQFPLSFLVDEQGDVVAERFPNLARLAGTATWYPNAVTASVRTDLSVPAALSGSLPSDGQLPVASQHPVNIFTLLDPTHDVVADEYVTQLCPDAVCGERRSTSSLWSDTRAVVVRNLLADDVADRFVPPIDDRWDGFGAEQLVADEARDAEGIMERRMSEADDRTRVAGFLDRIGTTGGPGLHYLHLLLPHEPLRFLPDGRSYTPDGTIVPDSEGLWPDDPVMMGQRLQQYLAQAQFADRIVGDMLDRLEEVGILDESIVVVTSDHGASTRPGTANRDPGDVATRDDVLAVPTFVKAPGQIEPRIDLRPTQQVDLLPTVIELQGGSTAGLDLDGVSLTRDPDEAPAPVVLTAEGLRPLRPMPDAASSPTVAWLAASFPHPGDPFRYGEHAELVGTELAALGPLPTDGALGATLADPGALVAVDTSGPEVPARAYGTLAGADESVPLAVALNGTVAGVGNSYEAGGWQFSVLVDPRHLVDGRNELRVLRIRPDRTLAEVPLVDP